MTSLTPFRVPQKEATGSSELTNYVRATSTILQNAEDSNVYNFTYSKRRKRAECEPVVYLRQGENGNIFWERTEKPGEVVKAKSQKTKYDGQGWENLQPCTYNELIDKIKDICGAAFNEEIGNRKADNIRRALLLNGKIILNKDDKKYQGALVWNEE